MTEQRTTPCRACGKPLLFIRTAKGKTAPVDAEPVRFREGAGSEKYILLTGEIVTGLRDPDGTEEGYVSHFATCPGADTYRKRGKKGDRG